jgi:hypothetical protein
MIIKSIKVKNSLNEDNKAILANLVNGYPCSTN